MDVLGPIHTERERCGLENGYETHLQEISLAATLAVGAFQINVFFFKYCH